MKDYAKLGVGLLALVMFISLGCASAKKDSAMVSKQEEMALRAAQTAPKAPIDAEAPVKKNQPAPDFTLIDVHDDTITLSSYKGKQPVILFFWTTWCPFCQKELRVLNDRYGGLVREGFEVLAIDVGEDPDKVTNFVTSYYLAYRVLLDKDTMASLKYSLVGVPTYVIVDKDGNIVFKDNFFPQNYKDLVAVAN